jgi:hypothetical protein
MVLGRTGGQRRLIIGSHPQRRRLVAAPRASSSASISTVRFENARNWTALNPTTSRVLDRSSPHSTPNRSDSARRSSAWYTDPPPGPTQTTAGPPTPHTARLAPDERHWARRSGCATGGRPGGRCGARNRPPPTVGGDMPAHAVELHPGRRRPLLQKPKRHLDRVPMGRHHCRWRTDTPVHRRRDRRLRPVLRAPRHLVLPSAAGPSARRLPREHRCARRTAMGHHPRRHGRPRLRRRRGRWTHGHPASRTSSTSWRKTA